MDARWYLSQVNLFRLLSEDDLEALERLIQMKTAPRRSVIMDPARPTKVVYFLKKGHVRLYKLGADGRPLVVAFLGPGNLFGETEAFSTGTADLYAEAVDDVVLCALTRPQLEEMMRRNPELAIKLIETLSARLRDMEEMLKQIAHRRVEERLVHVIARLAHQFGVRRGDYVCLESLLGHEDLAEMIGSTRETVSAVLSGLGRDGVVTTARRRICMKEERIRDELALDVPENARRL